MERDEAFAAWARFVESVAEQRPLVAVIEDIHWADPALLAFLEHLARRATTVPLLILATARPELYDHRPAWGSGLLNIATVSLAPLAEAETAAMVTGLLHQVSLPPETEALLQERSGGNPLYAEEFARALRDRGLVGEDGHLIGDVGSLQFPATLQALIAARLDALPGDGKEVLQDASVIGRLFWAGAVAFLRAADEPEVLARLREVERKELVRRGRASSVRGQAEYAFWHALVRDVAYGQITRAARSEKHRKAAVWIERMAGERLGDQAEILAHHATSALDLARASGETDLVDLERTAARYLRLAAQRTMSIDLAKAETQLLAALDLTPQDDPDRPRLLANLGEAAFHGGRLEEADRRYAEAIAGLREAGARLEAAEAMARRSVVLEYRGEMAGGRALLSEAIGLLERLPPGPELARTLSTAAGSAMVAGRYEETIALADRAIVLADAVGEQVAGARAHGFRGYSRALQGDRGGVPEQRAALDVLLALGVGRSAAIVYNNLGSCLAHVEGSQASLALFEEGVAFAQARGLHESVLALQDSLVTVLFEVGRWDEVMELSPAVVDEARRQGSGYDEVYAQTDQAMVRAYRQGASSLAFCEEVLELARPLEDPPLVLRALMATALARLAAGDLPGTGAMVREALELTTGDDVLVLAGDLAELTRLAVGAGDLALAERLLVGSDRLELERYRLSAFTASAVLAEARGDLDRALAGHQEAAERWDRWGNALERAHALFGAGRCLVALGRDAEGRQRLGEARGAFAALGAQPTIARIDQI